jgi:PPM family protein phosphatase
VTEEARPEIGRVAARSDPGNHRPANEDRYLVAPPLFVVADGMGGHEAGEVASGLAVETLSQLLWDRSIRDGGTLADAVRAANRAIREATRDRPEQAGMGTTCTALFVDGQRATLAHVGDSRAYLVRDGALRQLTEDHTLVGLLVREGILTPEQAARDERRHVIVRALGVADSVDVDLVELSLEPGDRLLLCSDGLSGPVTDERLAEALVTDAGPEQVVAALVDAAVRDGDDNVTAILVDVAASTAARPAAGPVSGVETASEAAAVPVATPARQGPGPGSRSAPRARRIAVTALLVILGAGVAGLLALQAGWQPPGVAAPKHTETHQGDTRPSPDSEPPASAPPTNVPAPPGGGSDTPVGGSDETPGPAQTSAPAPVQTVGP